MSGELFRRIRRILPDDLGEFQVAQVVAAGTPGVGHAIGIDNQAVAGRQARFAHLRLKDVQQPNHGARRLQPLHVAVRPQHQGRIVPAVGVAQRARVVVVVAEEQRREALGRRGFQELQIQGPQQQRQIPGRLPGQTASASDPSHQAAQDATHFVNIVGEQTLRPIVILIMIGLLALLVRIAVGFMEIGVRLTRLAVSDGEATQAAIKSLAEAIRHEKS